MHEKIAGVTTKRPWGEFCKFTENKETTIKVITVKGGEEFSLQYHKQRSEFWKILDGEAEVTIGDSLVRAKRDDELFIPANTNHRMKAIGGDVRFLEIAEGHFDEEDIVRLEDNYGRA